MINAYGQEMSIGSVVGGSYLAGCRNKSRVGIVVDLKRGTNGWEGETWKATVLWVEQLIVERYDRVVKSTVLVRNLFVLDDDTVDALIINALADAYADYFFDSAPSVFVAPLS